jgi:mRNA interferase MazF
MRCRFPKLPFLDRASISNVQGLGSIPIARLERRIGALSTDLLARIKSALAFALNLKSTSD